MQADRRMTNLEFAQRTASIARLASDWTSSILNPFDDGKADPDAVKRFVAGVRGRLDRLLPPA